MNIPILKTIKKVPGGIMLIPLILGAIINTFFPHALRIGGFTTALFLKGTGPLVALFLFIMGSQIKINKAGAPITRGLVSLISKFLVGFIITIIVVKFFGIKGIFGLTPLAIMAAFAAPNTGLYVALAESFGNKDDLGAASIISLSGGAFFTMVALGGSGFKIPYMSMFAVILPILIGFILGNIDEELRTFLGKGQHILTPFFGFSIGAGMTFYSILDSGIQGVLLALGVLIITGFVNYFAHMLIFKEKKAINLGIGTTGGNQLATPVIVAGAASAFLPYVNEATAQVAASVIITAILCPLLVGFMDKRLKKRVEKKNEINANEVLA